MIKTKILCPNRLRRITGSFAFIKHLFWLRDGLRDVRAELGLRDVRAELALVRLRDVRAELVALVMHILR